MRRIFEVRTEHGFGWAADDERRAGLVDEDRVHLVHDAVVQFALHAIVDARRHVVAQVIEAGFVVGDVGDVAEVGGATFRRRQEMLDDADGEAERFVDRAHPLRVALCKIVVGRDEMDAFALQRIQVDGQRRDERLAFAGAHLGDFAFVQHHAADELDIEVAHGQSAASRFATDRERFDEQVVEGGALA
jgi:hypothetical protein